MSAPDIHPITGYPIGSPGNLFSNFDFSRISVPEDHTKIYKRQCVLSFDTPRSEKGLFICLKTFLAFGSTYLADYSEKSGNTLFLNLKSVPRLVPAETDENDTAPAPTTTTDSAESPRTAEVMFGDEKVVLHLASSSSSSTADDDPYDIIYETLSCLVFLDHKSVLPLPNSQVPMLLQDVIDRVLSHDAEESKIGRIRYTSSEEPRLISEIAERMVQVGNKGDLVISSNPDDWVCEVPGCGLKENLWLNLTDGHMGCGRRNWDGTGGKNHGIEHYEKTTHSIVVKIGTVHIPERDLDDPGRVVGSPVTRLAAKPKVEAEVYCYKTNRMVIDPLLVKHLAHFGLDARKMSKVDKTIAQMEQDMNLKLEFASVTESGVVHVPVFGPGFTGLSNLGNTCYMNALLQVFFSMPEISQMFYDLRFQAYFDPSNRTIDPTGDLRMQLIKLANGLNSGIYSVPSEHRTLTQKKRRIVKRLQSMEDAELRSTAMIDVAAVDVDEPEEGEEKIGQDGIKPRLFKLVIGQGHDEFSSFRQQDPSEFLGHLFTRIERMLAVRGQAGDPTLDPKMLFQVVCEEKYRCSVTSMVKMREEPADQIFLPVPKEFALNHEEYSAYEIVKEGEEQELELRKQKRLLLAAEARKLRAEGREADIPAYVPDPRLDRSEPVRPHYRMQDLIRAFGAPALIPDFYSAAAGRKVAAMKTTSMKNFPPYLVFVIRKYYLGENYQPRKRDTFIEDPHHLDLSFLRASGMADDEAAMPEGEEPKPKSYNMDIVRQLMGMGFGENRCKRAAAAVSNANAEVAAGWLFEHMADAGIDDPLPEDRPSGAAAAGAGDAAGEPSAALISQMTGMGIGREEAIFSLSQTDNNVMRAVDWYFSHMDSIHGLMVQESERKASQAAPAKEKVLMDGPGHYDLFAFISHVGGNVGSGHYVCHIEKEGKWYYFNDSRVVESQETPFDRGYMYFYRRRAE